MPVLHLTQPHTGFEKQDIPIHCLSLDRARPRDKQWSQRHPTGGADADRARSVRRRTSRPMLNAAVARWRHATVRCGRWTDIERRGRVA